MKKIIKQEDKMTIVKLIEKGKIYVGKAKVHPEDEDFCNSTVGGIIAESRARAKRHKGKAKEHQKAIDNMIKQIKILEEARDYHLEMEREMNEFSIAYINRKDNFYKLIRKNRENPKDSTDLINSIASKLEEWAKVKNNDNK